MWSLAIYPVCFALGWLTGETAHRRSPGGVVGRERLISVIAILVGIVWAAVALVGLLEKDYTALTITTPVMLVVTGFLFGVKRNGNGGTK